MIAIDESNGALPRANLFGSAGRDTLTGGSSNDLLLGLTATNLQERGEPADCEDIVVAVAAVGADGDPVLPEPLPIESRLIEPIENGVQLLGGTPRPSRIPANQRSERSRPSAPDSVAPIRNQDAAIGTRLERDCKRCCRHQPRAMS